MYIEFNFSISEIEIQSKIFTANVLWSITFTFPLKLFHVSEEEMAILSNIR